MNRILFLTTHSLESEVRVGSYYYFNSISKFFDETYIYCAPVSFFHLLRFTNPDVRHRFSLAIRRFFIHPGGDENVCCFFTFFPASDSVPFNNKFFFENSFKFSLGRFPKYDMDFVYIDNPYMYSVLKSCSYKKLVVRIPDNFTSSPDFSDSYIYTVYKELIEKADFVICASLPVVKDVVFHYGIRPTLISNGVDLSRFQNLAFHENRTGSKKKVVFVGVFDYWVDLSLIDFLAKNLPEIEINLIGKCSPNIRGRLVSKNINFLGPYRPEVVVEELVSSNVGIVPFDTRNHKNFVDGINPLKAYEYLAAGIPVVSTDFAGARGISPYVTTAVSDEEFCQSVANYLDNPPDRDAVRKTAEPYDWSVVLKPFEDFVINSLGNSDES